MSVAPTVDHNSLPVFPDMAGVALEEVPSLPGFAGAGLVVARAARLASAGAVGLVVVRGAPPASPEGFSGVDVSHHS